MDPTGPTALRFPLLARPRPSCPPLEQRVAELVQRARAVEDSGDMAAAAAVFNLAALLASDVDLPELARQWCHRHAALYLHARPLDAATARHALEPLVNLARLQIRAGQGEHAFTQLEALFSAVDNRTEVSLDGLSLPIASLTESPQAHREVRQWLWVRLLATGARALASAGRWSQAHAQLERYNGIGGRMLDGRQVAVLAQATTGDHEAVRALLAATQPGEAWENAVTACLSALCGEHGQQGTEPRIATLLACYHQVEPTSGLEVFHTRLGLSALDAIAEADHPATRTIAHDLIHRAIISRDGYTARDLLAHECCAQFLTPSQARDLNDVVQACALGYGTIPASLETQLEEALSTSETILTRVLNPRSRPARIDKRVV